MKKLMIVFAAVAMAVAAQASSVKWGLNSGQTLTDITSGTAYLIQGTLPDTSSWSTKTSFTASDLGGTVYRTGEFSGGTYLSTAESITSPIGTYSVFMAVISDDGSKVAVASSTKSMRIAAAATPVSLQWSSSEFTTYGGGAEPEPTSGLLMLVGLGVLGLRRKRK